MTAGPTGDRGPRRRVSSGLAVLLAGLLLALAPGPSAGLVGPAAAAADEPVFLAQAPPSTADRRKAQELREVARDAVRVKERRGDDGDDTLDGLDLDVGGGIAWPLAIVVVVLLAVVGTVALARRGPRRRRRAAEVAVTDDARVADLEREARRAEEAGEHRAAVVLWFRAGTRRLRDARRVRAAETATPSEVARAAADDRVVVLAVDHDRAAYGPGPVGPDASRGAREGWAVVLREPLAKRSGVDPADRSAAPRAGDDA